ncbi:MAG TPA: glycosyl hydrolase family 32 [Microbacteriaceae bacterium]|nr:glycosyl hydrolase family 32 [Microbacteriaceae bacterium]
MVLAREHEWVWDSWYVVDGDTLHAFTLMAPKSLGDPDLRHINARVGHSTSTDGITWTHVGEALGPSEGDGFDSQATWTGSIVRHNGQWHMFFTGINRENLTTVQAIGHATSPDLMTWTRTSAAPVVRADAQYALLGNDHDGAEHFRDPWVFHHEGAWHMLMTASDHDGWGTIGHATSPDLGEWTLHAPLVQNSQLRQMEVVEVLEIGGNWVVLFCLAGRDIERPGVSGGTFATYSAPAAGPIGPFDLDRMEVIAEGVYAARAVFFQGEWKLFGFLDSGEPGGFTGTISDPIALELSPRGTLVPRG